ncbi:MAG: suppressor of fused domain protein [Candidatus Protochlamydia sp.]|nr:suppressor of fused domain protein [Candidatus Protochlamydia sp.]
MCDFFEEAWAEREEKVYKSFFPNMPETIITPIDPSKVAIGGEILVLSCAGVFEIPPTMDKKYWAYITSGLSNPFGDEPEETSGFGLELLIRVPEQSPWAINFLFNLMGYIFETQNPFDKGDRMPLNGPILAGSDSALNTVLFWPPEDLNNSFQLKSGSVQLLEVMGITEDEYQFAKKSSSEALYQELKKLPNFPITDVNRNTCFEKKSKRLV